MDGSPKKYSNKEWSSVIGQTEIQICQLTYIRMLRECGACLAEQQRRYFNQGRWPFPINVYHGTKSHIDDDSEGYEGLNKH